MRPILSYKRTKNVMAFILLNIKGWALTGGIDLSRLIDDKDTLVFSRIPVPSMATFGCISLADRNKIQLLDMPENVIQVKYYVF
jgi:hypothetical protein